MAEDGTLSPSQSQKAFSRIYKDGIGQESAALRSLGETAVSARALPIIRGPSRPPAPHADIRAGIEETALRYAGHPGLRAAIPALSHLASGIAHPQVRHMGTMGGSIANNDPAADYPAAIVGLGAEVVTTIRSIAADDFFTGLFSTALEPGEIVLRIRFPKPLRAGYCKIPSQASGYVTTGCFIAEAADGIRVAVNGAAACVFRQPDFEAALGRDFSVHALEGLVQAPDGLNNDMHASAAYRAHLVGVAARRALEQALHFARMENPQ